MFLRTPEKLPSFRVPQATKIGSLLEFLVLEGTLSATKGERYSSTQPQNTGHTTVPAYKIRWCNSGTKVIGVINPLGSTFRPFT